MLHILNKSASNSTALQTCLQFVQKNDAIILIENAVFAAHQCPQLTWRESFGGEVKVYVLQEDLAARGLTESDCLEFIEVIDYQGFVELVCQHKPIKSWF